MYGSLQDLNKAEMQRNMAQNKLKYGVVMLFVRPMEKVWLLTFDRTVSWLQKPKFEINSITAQIIYLENIKGY
jgi:hypothetical protein